MMLLKELLQNGHFVLSNTYLGMESHLGMLHTYIHTFIIQYIHIHIHCSYYNYYVYRIGNEERQKDFYFLLLLEPVVASGMWMCLQKVFTCSKLFCIPSFR